MIDLGILIDRLTDIRATEKFCGGRCTGKNINGKPYLVIIGNEELICIQLDDGDVE